MGVASDQKNENSSLEIQIPITHNRQTTNHDAIVESNLAKEERKSDYIFQNSSNIIKPEKILSFEKAMQSSSAPK